MLCVHMSDPFVNFSSPFPQLVFHGVPALDTFSWSKYLSRSVITPGLGVPDMAPVLEHFETAFDGEEAERTGRIVPHEGVDYFFDDADSSVKTATQDLAEYLEKQRKKFGNSSEVRSVYKLGILVVSTLMAIHGELCG